MSDRAQTLQDFTLLAKQTLVDHGLVPADALVQSAGKMLQRLADPIAPFPSSSSAPSSTLTHEDILRRCASHGAA
jgi:hypothetical protein